MFIFLHEFHHSLPAQRVHVHKHAIRIPCSNVVSAHDQDCEVCVNAHPITAKVWMHYPTPPHRTQSRTPHTFTHVPTDSLAHSPRMRLLRVVVGSGSSSSVAVVTLSASGEFLREFDSKVPPKRVLFLLRTPTT